MTGVGIEPTACGLKVDHSQCTIVCQCPLMQMEVRVFRPAPVRRFAFADMIGQRFGHNIATVRVAGSVTRTCPAAPGSQQGCS